MACIFLVVEIEYMTSHFLNIFNQGCIAEPLLKPVQINKNQYYLCPGSATNLTYIGIETPTLYPLFY
jgi:hypothetical protein